jgi:hypothetical protein
MMSGEAKLGTAPAADAERDAVHVAVYPCMAGERLMPGDNVRIEGGKALRGGGESVGIADPFRGSAIDKGERLYVCLFPGTTIGMRHHWKHPAFDVDKAQSELWLRQYAAAHNTYDAPDKAFERLLAGLRTKALHFYGTDTDDLDELDDADELKRHAEIYLGVTIDWGEYSFSCSC